MDNKVTLYGHGSYGTRVWSIWSEENIIKIQANGQLYEETIHEGKAGRSIEQQVQLRIEARVRNKLSQGFKASKEELGNEVTNQLGLYSPMLAQHAKNTKRVDLAKCFVQPKLDGHRCLVNSEVAYSRGGKLIETIPEILQQLDVPEGVTLDGELYAHGYPLQTIASWAKRRQQHTLKLQFHVYDIIVPDDNLSFLDRFNWITDNVKVTENVKIVDTHPFSDRDSVLDWYQSHRRGGFEGSILRPYGGKYEIGKRSKNLLKVKMRFDDEFKCVDILEDKVGNGVLLLETKEGKQFKTVAPGPQFVKREQFLNKEAYIGKYVTCEYAELSIDKIPQHCVAIRWRNDI